MSRKRLVCRNFSFIWDGLIHLEDGSLWHLTDSSRRHDVTWWETGETVELVRVRGVLVLRNVLRDEAVPVTEAGEELLRLAA